MLPRGGINLHIQVPPSVCSTLATLFDAIGRMSPYGQRTVVLVPKFLHDIVASIATATGFSTGMVAFTVATFLCYPLAFIMYYIPHGQPKHLANFIFGAFILQFVIGEQWLHILISTLICYELFLILPPRYANKVVPVFVMTYMSLAHIHRMVSNYNQWSLDFVTPQMIVTIKLYQLAYNISDGEKLRQAQHSGKEVGRGVQRCAECAVYALPNPVEFLGYAFCFSTVLAGPPIEYRIYDDAASGALLLDDDGKPRGKIPSRLWPTLIPFLVSLVCMGLYVVGTATFPFLDKDNPEYGIPVILTDEFLKRPIIIRFLYTHISLFFVRMRYYFPWKSAEGATNLWLCGFDGFDENGNAKGFDRGSNVDILVLETSQSFRKCTRALNKKTASWLNRYVYGRTNKSLVATNFVSAFWHGFYPGYYLYSLSSPLLSICERVASEKLSPDIVDTSRWEWKRILWNTLAQISVKFVFNYTVGPFFLLTWQWSLDFWKSYGYLGHILCIAFYLGVSLLPKKKN